MLRRRCQARPHAYRGLSSRFACVRVRTSPIRRAKDRGEETLLIEWPEGESEPTKYRLSTLPKRTSLRRLVDIAKMRWRIERDYQELKQEIGLAVAIARTLPRCPCCARSFTRNGRRNL